MVTTLYLIRHGETEGDGKKRYKGSIDVPLSGNGVRQVERTSDFLVSCLEQSARSRRLSYLMDIHGPGGSGTSLDGRNREATEKLFAVYTSDLSRARRSAEIIARPYGLIPVVMPELRERNFGIWEGMSFDEIKIKYPAEFEAWAGNPLTHSPIEGESTLQVRDRVLPAIEKILDGNRGQNVAVVAHGGVNRLVICHTLGMPLENIFRIEQDYGAANIIEYWEKYPVVKLINGTTADSK